MSTTVPFFRDNRVPTIREVHNLLLAAEDAGRENEAYIFAEEFSGAVISMVLSFPRS